MALTNNRYIYLAGKIKVGHNATEYRAVVAPILRKYGIFSLDPLRGKYVTSSWHALDPNEVVVRDLQDIERAHVMLAVMLKYNDSSFGTPCEIMYAWERHIPVILITNEKYLKDHFWPKSLCSRIFFVDEAAGDSFNNTLLEAAEHIGHWYGNVIEDDVYKNPRLIQKEPVVVENETDLSQGVIHIDVTPAPQYSVPKDTCCRCGYTNCPYYNKIKEN